MHLFACNDKFTLANALYKKSLWTCSRGSVLILGIFSKGFFIDCCGSSWVVVALMCGSRLWLCASAVQLFVCGCAYNEIGVSFLYIHIGAACAIVPNKRDNKTNQVWSKAFSRRTTTVQLNDCFMASRFCLVYCTVRIAFRMMTRWTGPPLVLPQS